jgi:small subunit ribosomal protein S1
MRAYRFARAWRLFRVRLGIAQAFRFNHKAVVLCSVQGYPMSTDPTKNELSISNPRASAYDADLEREIEAALGGLTVEDLENASTPARQAARGRQVRHGTILRVHDGDVFVEFGPRSQGVCPLAQFLASGDQQAPVVGSERGFIVERFDPFEGLSILSLEGVVQKADWGTLEIGQIVEARCTGMNKGGLEMELAHHRAFMPAGQVDVRHVADISVFIGEKFPVQIVELNKEKDRLVVSRKAVVAVERAEQREKLMAVLELGQTRTATITSVQSYGAFADIGGVDGLIHVSDLSHERVKSAADVVKVGQVVMVKIVKLDLSQSPPKIGLGLKQLVADPGVLALDALAPGATITGRVTKLMAFGAFIEIAPGVEGLVHISEISHERIPSVDKALRANEIVTCKILSLDLAAKRISLSIKALLEAPARPEPQQAGGAGGAPAGGGGGGAPSFAGGRRQEKQEGFSAAFGRGRGKSEGPVVTRAEDPALKRLRATWGTDKQFKGGLG